MIISASRRTDIPAFYAGWFMNRLREGFCMVTNPFNPRSVSRVSLASADVDAIVFWSKDPAPMLGHLEELDRRGYRYYFLYTLTGYPSFIEPGVPPLERGLETFRALSGRLGPGRVIWRFDPILLSTATPEEWITDSFGLIASSLRGRTERVIISFTHFYGKVRRRLGRLKEQRGIECRDAGCDPGLAGRIASRLAGIARENGMRPLSCAQKTDLSAFGVEAGSCVDAGLINSLFGTELSARKDRSQRKECGCAESRDIGQYDTCLHGCLYCYASQDGRKAAGHDPRGAFLTTGRRERTGVTDSASGSSQPA
jgi:hypothetical protein